MNDAGQLWETCQDLIRAQVSDVVWNTTFRHLEAIDLTDSAITVAVPSQVMKDRIEARYLGIVRDAITESNNGPLEMAFQVRMDEQALLGLNSTVLDLTEDSPRIDMHLPEVVEASTPDRLAELPSNGDDRGADRYTFEAFVTGTCLLYTSDAADD